MQHPLDALEGEYDRLLAACQITEQNSALAAAKRILNPKPRYTEVLTKSSVQVLWIMAINEQESGSDLENPSLQGNTNCRRLAHLPTILRPFAANDRLR
jgi:lysozyme family protein